MFITVLAPEIIVAKALDDLLGAIRDHRKFAKSDDEVKHSWTLAHMYYANMGGFTLQYLGDLQETTTTTDRGDMVADEASRRPGATTRFPSSTSSSNTSDGPCRRSLNDTSWCQEHEAENFESLALTPRISHEIPSTRREPGLPLLAPDASITSRTYDSASSTSFSPSTSQKSFRSYHLTADMIYRLIEAGQLPRCCPISAAEISDKSKSDILGKIVAVGQTSWFCIEVVTRKARGLPISQFEVGVTAFAFCSVITYAMNLKKPKGIMVATALKHFSGPIPDDVRAISIQSADDNYDVVNKVHFRNVLMIGETTSLENRKLGHHIPNDYTREEGLMGLLLISVPFGAIHLAAWDYTFPTQIDRDVWRSAAIVTTVILALSTIGILKIIFKYVVESRRFTSTVGITLGLIWPATVVVVYILARLALIVEMFRCLFYLPPDAYLKTWASNIPHFG